MAEEPSIDELIAQLKRIRVQEARVIEQIERASARETQTVLRAERVLQAERDQAARTVHKKAYQIGDRVRIINGVRAGQVETGIVTGVTATRVSITTDDGTRTWRAHKNIIFYPF